MNRTYQLARDGRCQPQPHSTPVSARLRFAGLLLALALFVSACGPAGGPQPEAGPSVPLDDCVLSAPGGAQVDAECGSLEVPEDPDNPGGRTISLKIAVVRAVSRAPAPDPLFLLAGGPGQAATEAFAPLLPTIERVQFDRDLVMVDQRGTGESRPLECAEPETELAYGEELPLEEQLDYLAECRVDLGIDPLLYTTSVAAKDLDAVREALGYERINLLGVSYGTRAALEYYRQFPERVRSLILDGVVPPDWVLGAHIGVDAQRALELIFDRCQATPACQERFPNLRADFDALVERLAGDPQTVTVIHPRKGEPVEVFINDQTLAATVRLMSYSDSLAALLPLMIDSAARGSYDMLAAQYIIMVGDLEHSLSFGMYYSVICAEDTPFLPAEPPRGEAFLDPRLDQVRAACQVWLPDPPPPPSSDLPAADVPALLISGEADPVTPPANGDALATLLPNSRHIVLPGLGHNNFYVGCVPNLLYDFLDALDPQGLDTACIETIRPQPFFLSPLGPEP